MKRKKIVVISYKFILEYTYRLVMACDEMRKRHFNDKINAIKWKQLKT